MPNIFGRNESDYSHLGAIRDAKLLDAHNAQLDVRGMKHDFSSLRDTRNPLAMPFNDVEANAQAVGFVTNNLQAIQAEIEEILYLDFRLDDFFPIVTNIPEGARTYSYRVVDHAGQGRFIETDGKSAPAAQTSLKNIAYNLEYGGIVPQWTMEDLRRAQFGGIALDTETIRAGTEGAMDHIEQVGISGSVDEGFLGLTNHSQITTTTTGTTIANMSADEITTFIQGQVTNIITQTNEIFGRVIKKGLTLYVPIAQYDRIVNTRLSDNADKTVWEYVRMNNTWTNYTGNPIEIKAVAEMDQAGASDADRMLVGFNNDRVMEMAMPIMPRVITTINQGYVVQAPIEYKISGLNVKRPTAMRYVDGI